MSLGSCSNHLDFMVIFDTEVHYECPVCGGVVPEPTNQGYVSRGNVPDFDFGVADLIADSEWHDLDISHIVPAGERLVKIVFAVQSQTHQGLGLILRHPDHTYNRNNIRTCSTILGQCSWMSDEVLCSADGKLKYYLYAGTYSAIHITIRGWQKKVGE